MITTKDLNPKKYVTTKEQEANLEKLASALSKLEELYGKPFLVTSGLRSYQDQLRINPRVKDSAHLAGQAADINDPDKDIWGFIVDNLEVLVVLGLYVESKAYSPRHVHLQTRAPKSGNRIFIP